VETTVARIWAEVLKLERVGRTDNFFALGGHSLLAVQVVGRLRQALDFDLAITDLFANPGLSQLAAWVVDTQLATFSADDLAHALKQMQAP
jgi:acyl carrier protein